MCLRFRGHPVDCKVRSGVAPLVSGDLSPRQWESRASPGGSCSWFVKDFTYYTDVLGAPQTPQQSPASCQNVILK